MNVEKRGITPTIHQLLKEVPSELGAWRLMPHLIGRTALGQQVIVDYEYQIIADLEGLRARLYERSAVPPLGAPRFFDPEMIPPLFNAVPYLPGAEALIVQYGLYLLLRERIADLKAGKIVLCKYSDPIPLSVKY